MTSEVVIMNKEAIALAADSAVTMEIEEDRKIKTSANKLFALSKYHPVGLMVYGDAVFMGVPWETIIKIYRNRLGKEKFDTLEEYANDFIAVLGNVPQTMTLITTRFNNLLHGWSKCKRPDIVSDLSI